jgi:cyanophycin synthetase
LLKNILMAQGHRVGLVCTDGMYVQNTLRRIGDFSGGTPCRDLLLQPDIDAAVMETARGGMLKWGLGFDRCDVAVMTAVTDTQTGMDGIPDEDAMADLKGYLLEAATDAVVLNADDHRVMLQRSRVPADCQVLLFSQNPDNPEILEHVRRGGTAVILRGRGEGACIRVCEAANEQTLVSVADVPLVSARGQRHNMGNVMAAAAAALGMAVPKADIVRGLTTLKDNPGRQMFIEGLPFRLVLDRAECRTRMQALCQVAQAQPVFGRRLLLMTMPGNRPDQHFDDVARVVAGQFDHFVLFSWMDLRGRSRDFMPARLMSALTEAGVDPSCIDTVSDQAEAYAHGLRMAAPGDLLCVVMLERGLARDAFLDLVNQGPDFPADHYRAFLRRAKQSLGGSKQVRTSGAVPVEEDAPL